MKQRKIEMPMSSSGTAKLKLLVILILAVLAISLAIMRSASIDPNWAPPLKDWRDRRESLQDPVIKPTEYQPTIDNPLKFSSELYDENGMEQGRISLTINTDGKLKGKLNCECLYERADFRELDAEFIGHIKPSKVYRRRWGKDPSKLFFIGLKLDAKTGERSQRRQKSVNIWVNGWLDSDYKAVGKVFCYLFETKFSRHKIQMNEIEKNVFTWEARASD
ncbi:MAG: hypothetical protein ACYS83_09225 [Planctomycetota bacterium]|jgi:hypothetical protein